MALRASLLPARLCRAQGPLDRWPHSAAQLQVIVARKRSPPVHVEEGNALRGVVLQQVFGDPARRRISLAIANVEVVFEHGLDSGVAVVIRDAAGAELADNVGDLLARRRAR